MKTKFFLLTAIAVILSITSCDVLNKTLSFVSCTYELDGIANPSVGGVTLNNITNVNQISAINMLKLTTAVAQGSLPLSATVNVKAKNPGTGLAEIEKLEWAIDLENKQILQGLVNQRISVPAKGGTATIPFNLNVDLLQLIKNGGINDLVNLALNLANAGEGSSKVAIRVKPTVSVGGQLVSSGFITLSKSVNSK